MITHKELPPPDELLKPRDLKAIIIVPPQTWTCQFCESTPRRGAGTTVEWVGPGADGADGRCRECGQKYCLGSWQPHKVKKDELTDWRDGRWPYKWPFWARGAA